MGSGSWKEENEFSGPVYEHLPGALLSRTGLHTVLWVPARGRVLEAQQGAGRGPSLPEPQAEALHGPFRL